MTGQCILSPLILSYITLENPLQFLRYSFEINNVVPVVALTERKTSIHRDLLLSSDLNDMILESIVLQRVFLLYSTEMSFIDNDTLFSHLSASQDIVAASLLKRIKKCGFHRVRQGTAFHHHRLVFHQRFQRHRCNQ